MDHLQRKEGGGEGGAEEGGEGGGHAADGEHPALLRLHAHGVGDLVGDGGPQLEGGPLPARRAAHQMGDTGRQEDEGGGAQMHGLVLPDGHQHQVGAPILFHAAGPVEQNDGQTADGQQQNEPVVGLAELGDQVDTKVEGHAHRSDQQADQNGENTPTQKIQKIQPVGAQHVRRQLHGNIISAKI